MQSMFNATRNKTLLTKQHRLYHRNSHTVPHIWEAKNGTCVAVYCLGNMQFLWWTLDPRLDSWTRLWTALWTGFWIWHSVSLFPQLAVCGNCCIILDKVQLDGNKIGQELDFIISCMATAVLFFVNWPSEWRSLLGFKQLSM